MNIMKLSKKTLYITSIVGIIVIIAASYFVFFKEESKPPVTKKIEKPKYLYGIKTNLFEVVQDEIMRNKSLSEMLLEAGLSQTFIHQIQLSCDSVFDVRKIKAGNPFTMLKSKNDSIQKLQYFIYEINNVDYVIFDLRDSTSLKIYKKQKPVQQIERKVKGVIESSLWNAMVDNGLSPALAMELSEMYAWTIDFFGLQKGDYFKVVFVEEFIDGESVGLKELKYAMFNHQGVDYYALPFTQNDGKKGYYDEKGQGLKKAFLKAPLKFSRISSYFSRSRMHPVLRIVRPHYGVDYAAPVGTPVMSIGHGVVIKRGYSGGAGNMIKIKHNKTYTTTYMHLSRYARGVYDGARIQQGQVIGYVGSTGLSSGPHLDFRVFKNGKPVNPLKVVSPPAEPVSKSRMPEFIHMRDSLLTILNSIK